MLPARLNPFRTEQLHQLPFLPHPQAEQQAFADLQRQQYSGSIVGPHGSGKTTLLLRLQTLLEQTGIPTWHFRCQEDTPLPAPNDWDSMTKLPPSTVILLDGAELLSPKNFARLKTIGAVKKGLVITSTHPLDHPTLYTTTLTVDILRTLLRHLIPDHVHDIDAHALFDQHQGNLRDIFRELYDQWSQRE